MPMNDGTEQSKMYAFVSASKNVWDKLLKLHKTKLFGSQIKIKEVKSTRGQTIVVLSPAKNHPAVVNKNLEKQSSLQNLPLVPGKENYCEATQLHPSSHSMLIFTDSIQKCIRMYEFNSLLRDNKGQILNFPGSSSK